MNENIPDSTEVQSEFMRTQEISERQSEIQEAQTMINELLSQLERLQFADYKQVLTWLRDYQRAGDVYGVVKNPESVIAVFQAHGMTANMRMNEQFHQWEKDKVAEYIIGQALDGLAHDGAVHSSIHDFVEDWEI